jgi:hypothetical protein
MYISPNGKPQTDGIPPSATETTVRFTSRGAKKGKVVSRTKESDDPGVVDGEVSARFGRGPGWRNKQNSSPKSQLANHREVAGAAIGIDARKHPSRVKNNESFDAAMAVMPRTRMRRSVWDVPSRGYKDAHFATFPPDLIAPMILAGSRVGDVVLDPFMGSGTVAQVAQALGRRWIGIDLHDGYAPMQSRRAAQHGLELHPTPQLSSTAP